MLIKVLGAEIIEVDIGISSGFHRGFGTALNGPDRYNLLNRMGAADLVPFFSTLATLGETDAEVDDQPPPSRPTSGQPNFSEELFHRVSRSGLRRSEENSMEHNYYAKQFDIIHSSGMGRSRLVREMGGTAITISFALRRAGEPGLLPCDREVYVFLSHGWIRNPERIIRMTT
jgi:hypothetical protein